MGGRPGQGLNPASPKRSGPRLVGKGGIDGRRMVRSSRARCERGLEFRQPADFPGRLAGAGALPVARLHGAANVAPRAALRALAAADSPPCSRPYPPC